MSTKKEIFTALKELLEYVETEGKGIEEHDFFTDHDSDQCVLCKAREIVTEYEEEREFHNACVVELRILLEGGA